MIGDSLGSRPKQSYWNTEIEKLFMEKQSHLKDNGRDDRFKQLDDQLKDAISTAKNASFQEFASGLDHCNRNSDVYRAIRNVGTRRAARISEF